MLVYSPITEQSLTPFDRSIRALHFQLRADSAADPDGLSRFPAVSPAEALFTCFSVTPARSMRH